MIDVMTKLKEIAESGYDNEDIQRGIAAAATQNYEVSEEDNKLVSEISVLASEDDVSEGTEMGTIGNVAIKQFGAGNGRVGVQLTGPDGYIQLSMEETTELAGRLGRWAAGIDKPRQGEYDESVSSDADGEDGEFDEDMQGKDNMGFTDKQIKMAYGVLNDPRYKGGNYSGAVEVINKIAPGLADHPSVAKALQRTNEAVCSDAVEEVHEDVEEDTSLADMLKLAGRSGVMGLSQNNLIAESLELDEEDEVEEAEEVEEEDIEEAEVEETVEVPVAALEELMRLAGYENYEAKIDEYENEPEEEYTDIEDQLIGLSGGLNGPKGMYPTAAGGDNAMSVKPLKVDEENFLSFESFYKKYQEFVTEEK